MEEEEEAFENDPILRELRAAKSWELFMSLRRFSRCLLDPDLLAAKAFCLFLYGACGALLPYLPLYFKQFGLHAYQVGIIVGVGPIIQCLGSPAWSAIANKWKIGKFVFLSGVLSWLVKALLILAVHPRAQVCIQTYKNSTTNLTYVHTYHLWQNKPRGVEKHWSLVIPKPTLAPKSVQKPVKPSSNKVITNSTKTASNSTKRTLQKELYYQFSDNDDNGLYKSRRLMQVAGELLLSQVENQHEFESKLRVKTYDSRLKETVNSTIKIDRHELDNLFLIFLLFVVIGDFLQAPTFTLADASVLNRLEEDHRESPVGMRAAGSLGWMITVLVVGTIIYDSGYALCGGTTALYYVAFYFFIGFVCMAFVNALWFQFTYEDKRGSAGIGQVISLFANRRDGAFLVCVLYLGMCYGFLVHFLNWYIEDLGGTTLIMGTASAVRELIALVFFLVGGSFLPILGHVNVLVLSLLCYAVCFFSYWRLASNVFLVVAIGALEGATFASLWRSCERYFARLGQPLKINGSTQYFLQATFWGLGNGGGAVAGGALYHSFGAKTTFCALGVSTLMVCLLYLITCYVDYELTSVENTEEDESIDSHDVKEK